MGSWREWDVPRHIVSYQRGYERACQAWRMRAAGMLYREIGTRFGVTTERARKICLKGESYASNGYSGPLNQWLEDERLRALTRTADDLGLHTAAIRVEKERQRLNKRYWSGFLQYGYRT